MKKFILAVSIAVVILFAGYYAYYQTSRHPQCPKCQAPGVMSMARIHYTEFMHMSCQERDEYLSQAILASNPSLLERLIAPHKKYNSRAVIAEMSTVIMNLDTENKILNDTVNWMHDTIWDMLRQQQASGSRPSGTNGGWQPVDEADSSSCEAAVTEELQENGAKIEA